MNELNSKLTGQHAFLVGKSEEYKQGFVSGQEYGWHEYEIHRTQMKAKEEALVQALENEHKERWLNSVMFFVAGAVAAILLALMIGCSVPVDVSSGAGKTHGFTPGALTVVSLDDGTRCVVADYHGTGIDCDWISHDK